MNPGKYTTDKTIRALTECSIIKRKSIVDHSSFWFPCFSFWECLWVINVETHAAQGCRMANAIILVVDYVQFNSPFLRLQEEEPNTHIMTTHSPMLPARNGRTCPTHNRGERRRPRNSSRCLLLLLSPWKKSETIAGPFFFCRFNFFVWHRVCSYQ